MMKKFVLVFGVIILIVFAGNSFVEAQSNFDVSWSAVNISKDNANAITNGVRPGDVVRYEVVLTGGAGPGNYNPRIDMGDVLSTAEVVNLGGGDLEENELVFPPELCAGCDEQRFSFFVRVKDICDTAESMTISLNTVSIVVPLDCDLPDSGSSILLFLSIGFIISIMGYFIFSLRRGGIN
jgi:hypothetical protein